MKIDTKQFLEDILGNEQINFNCIGPYARKVNGYYNDHIINILKQFNDQNHEIYFVVNSGGYSGKDITKINSVFIDLDCGRDQNGNFYPLDFVKQYKDNKYEEVHKYKFKPSYIVETRNGYHVYWLVKSGATIEQFEECENRFINYFEADKKVKNPARLLRVPGWYWCKDPTNKFMCEIIERNEVRYSIKELIDSVPENVKDKSRRKRDTLNNNINTINYCTPLITSNDNNIELIIKRDIDKLHTILNPDSKELNSHNEVYEYLKHQDLPVFLGLTGKTFKCIFHDDNNPSAGIIINDTTGHYIYNCFSERCGFRGTIIECVQKLLGTTTIDALNFLRKVYKISYSETEWQGQQKNNIEENKRIFCSGDFGEDYPNLYKRIAKHIRELYILHDHFKNHIITVNFSDEQENAIAFMGLREIAVTLDRTLKNTQRKIGLFTYLGLLKKVKPKNIPGFLLNQSRKLKYENKSKYIINYYSIPYYSDSILSFGEEKAIEFKEKSYTMAGFSREMLLRGSGEDEADRVFPQMQGQDIPELNQKVTLEIEKAAVNLILKKGWTTEKEILDNIKGHKQFKETQIKRVIAELLDKYALVKRKLNKKLRYKFDLPARSFFYIIFREEDQ